MYKFIKIIFLLLICTSCAKEWSYTDITYAIMNKKAEQLSNEDGMDCIGSGGSMRDKVSRVTMMFQIKRRVEIDEARLLCVHCVEDLKNALNANEELQVYLSPYPFPSSATEISIHFIEKLEGLFEYGFIRYGCAYLGTGGISIVQAHGGYIYYGSYNSRTRMLEDYYEETYEDALQMLQDQGYCFGQQAQ